MTPSGWAYRVAAREIERDSGTVPNLMVTGQRGLEWANELSFGT